MAEYRHDYRLVSLDLMHRKTIGLFATVVAALVVLFDVTFVMDFGGSTNIDRPDPAIEAQYLACFQQRDEVMHDIAFGTIDNPDVQREYISANRARIARVCRNLHPQQFIEVQENTEFNLIDVYARFW